MIKIGITGSLASGKSTASRILSFKRGPLFSADLAVKQLYKNKNFLKLLRVKFKIKSQKNIKKSIKKEILVDKTKIKKLEKIIHPFVRKKMRKFTFLNKKRKALFFEIPLLVESKLMNYFDIIIFIKAKKKLRLRRFLKRKGDKRLFQILNDKQMKDNKKIKFCDYVVVNEKNLNILKKNLLDIIIKYA